MSGSHYYSFLSSLLLILFISYAILHTNFSDTSHKADNLLFMNPLSWVRINAKDSTNDFHEYSKQHYQKWNAFRQIAKLLGNVRNQSQIWAIKALRSTVHLLFHLLSSSKQLSAYDTLQWELHICETPCHRSFHSIT